MSDPATDFDPIGIVVDWLDACREADLQSLVSLYDDAATLVCKCDGRTYRGLTEIGGYWRPKLFRKAPGGFVLKDIQPCQQGLDVRYLGFEGKPLDINFEFSEDGKIKHTICGPSRVSCTSERC